MAEYAIVTGSNSFLAAFERFFIKTIDFMQTPAGMAVAGAFILLFFILKR